MAKIPYTKLKIKTEEEVKEVEFNSIKIEVKQYLPIQEKLDMINVILNNAREEDINFHNPIKTNVFIDLEIIFRYTNLSFTDKQKENIPKLYDELYNSKLLQTILSNIPNSEINLVTDSVFKVIKSIYEYQNSAYGIIEGISSQYKTQELNVEKIQKDLNEIQESDFYKNISSFIGIN